MATEPFRMQLPERRVVDATIAEFLLKRESDAGELARRARVLAALAELPARRRRELEEAVGQVCRAIAAHGGTATVRFALTERLGQRFVEVSVQDQRPANGSGSGGPSGEEVGETAIERVAEMLDHFETSSRAVAGAMIRMGQALSPAFPALTEAEVAQWGELLRTRSAEDALMLAAQHCRYLSLALGHVRQQEQLRRGLGPDATAEENLAVLSLVASKAKNPVSIMEPDGTISWVNEAFVQMTGYSPLEATGKRPDELLFGPSTEEAAVRQFQQALRNGHELTQEILLYRQDGRTFWAECNLIPVHDQNGQLTRWISIDMDITKHRQTEEALRRAKEQAEASSRLKSEFLANMSHEIRTPMNAIIGMTELALTTHLTPQQREYLETVQSSAESLLQLLNDILDLSKIEAGKLVIEQVDFNLAEVIRETLRALAVKAHEKGLELVAHVPMDLPQHLRGDPVRLRQILFNLVGNAVKFTERGEVVLDVEEQWRSDEEVGLHFAVRDTGIGIPPEKLNRIFEAFTQADSAITRRFGGTGLGLTITAELVRLMGGKIWVQSAVGKGSTFHFTLQLKLAPSPAPPADRPEVAQLEGRRVLVVDDNATNRRILDELLRHWKLQPTLADSARAALDELEEASRCDQPFDLVLLDAMMPEMDGFQLAETIRRRPNLKCGTVMMLSSADRPDSMARCRQMGITSYLVKPVTAASLLDAILAAIGAKATPTPPPPSTPSPAAPPDERPAETAAPEGEPAPVRLRILVVDDHDANRRLATTVLSRRGHKCVEATDGHQALAALQREPFDVVLMDVQMPNMDGFEATRAIREKEKTTGKHLPIIALTAHAMAGDRDKCLAAGMDSYLAKPLRPRELVSLVEHMVGATTGVRADAVTRETTTHGLCDFDVALESMDNDLELLVQQMEFFLNDGPVLMGQIHRAIDNRDARQLELAAHRLKGLVARYACHQAAQLALKLEQMGQQNQFDEAKATAEQLGPLVEQLVREVRGYIQQHR